MAEESRFAKLTSQQQWEWHADVYAFRHVVLGRSIDEPTPCDPEMKWFSRSLVDAAVARKLKARTEAGERYRKRKGEDNRREGRAIADEWARRNGYANFEAYLLKSDDDYGSAIRSMIAEWEKEGAQPSHIAAMRNALGVAAREFKPSRQRMAADLTKLMENVEP